jgi:hypothetical protein
MSLKVDVFEMPYSHRIDDRLISMGSANTAEEEWLKRTLTISQQSCSFILSNSPNEYRLENKYSWAFALAIFVPAGR